MPGWLLVASDAMAHVALEPHKRCSMLALSDLSFTVSAAISATTKTGEEKAISSFALYGGRLHFPRLLVPVPKHSHRARISIDNRLSYFYPTLCIGAGRIFFRSLG